MCHHHGGGSRGRQALQEARTLNLDMYLQASKAKQSRWASKAQQGHKAYLFANLAARPQRKHRDRRHPSWNCGAALRRAATNRASQPVWVDGAPPPLALLGYCRYWMAGLLIVKSNRRTYVIITAGIFTGGLTGRLLHPFNPNSSPIWANSGTALQKKPQASQGCSHTILPGQVKA